MKGAIVSLLGVLGVVAALAGCIPSEGPLMRPGSDCLACHGGQRGAPTWTVAGTLYDEPYQPGSAGVMGASVRITDSGGRFLSLGTNRAGNFYTAEAVSFPLRVCVERRGVTSCMEEPVSRGSCNVCHGPNGTTDPLAHGRLFPIGAGTSHAGVACAACHGATRAPSDLRCAACHAALDPSLGLRHTVATSDPEIVVADFLPVSEACVRCHGDAQVNRTAAHPAGMPGAPPHEDATCTTCHDTFRADKPWAADFATPPSSWPAGSGRGCASCHEEGAPGDD